MAEWAAAERAAAERAAAEQAAEAASSTRQPVLEQLQVLQLAPSPPAAVVSCLLERKTMTGSLQKQFLVRWVGEAQSDSWHGIDAFIWRPEILEALSRREGFARLEDDPWYPADLHTTEGTILSILRRKGEAAEEARAAEEAKAAAEARAAGETRAAAEARAAEEARAAAEARAAEEARAAAEARAAEQARAAAEARAAEDAALRQQIGAKIKLALQLRANDKPAAIQALREALREAKQLEATLKARSEARAAEEARAAAEAKAAELVAARAAKEKHQELANVHDVVPMVMKREEVRKKTEEEEEARKVAAAPEGSAAASTCIPPRARSRASSDGRVQRHSPNTARFAFSRFIHMMR